VANVSRAAISQRYALLPYLYTTLFYSSITGNPISRPLFFAAPKDEAVRSTSYQWMFGDGIMIAPVVCTSPHACTLSICGGGNLLVHEVQ
jgi:alpha-glucosidase (family GH31 glycosyl hydrolase)